MNCFKQTRMFVLIAVFMVGCAQKVEKEIERKVAIQPTVSNNQEFLTESDKIINEADNI